MKKCSICNIEKTIDKFPKNYKKTKTGSTGLRSNCKECENKRRRDSYKKNPVTGILSNIKQRCIKENIPFNITKEDIIIPNLCPILKIKLERGTKKDYKYSPTVDRIIPSKGYVKGNIKVISMMANRMKSNATVEEINLFIENIKDYLNDDIV